LHCGGKFAISQLGQQEQEWAEEAGHRSGIRTVIPGANREGQGFCTALEPSEFPIFT
jgi:hypothetical protein